MKPKVDEERVRAIKLALAGGAKPSEVADTEQLPYMVVYKIATGVTWKHVVVEGIEAVDGNRLVAKREVVLSSAARDKLYTAKRQSGASNATLARASGLSESMVARAVREAHALLAAKVQRYLLTSGSHNAACEQFGLTPDEAECMVAYASSYSLSERLSKELEASLSEG